MKFDISIDLDRNFIEDCEIEDALKYSIIHSVKDKIIEDMNDRIDEEIREKVKDFMDARMSVVINDQIQDCIENDEIQSKDYGADKIKIKDYIKKEFESNSGWRNTEKHIDRICKEFAADMKLQYNNLFASKIIENMKKQGFMKDEVAQMLLNGE